MIGAKRWPRRCTNSPRPGHFLKWRNRYLNRRETPSISATRLVSYKAALDEGGDAVVIGKWITETSAERALPRNCLPLRSDGPLLATCPPLTKPLP